MPGSCRLDVVADLADRVPVRVAEDYFGILNPGGKHLLEWIQLTSFYIFNPFASDDDRTRAVRAGAQMKEHVESLVQARLDTPRTPATVLDHLVAACPNDVHTDEKAYAQCVERVARTITGLVAGSLGPPPRMFVKAVDRLLDLFGDERSRLEQAAADKNDPVVANFLLEGARFAPDPVLLYRSCELPGTTLHGFPIEVGDTVVGLVDSALMDGRNVYRPRQFRLDRSEEERMLFGHGLHECIGREVGVATLVGMAQPLFALEGLRRAWGRRGMIQQGTKGEHPAQSYPQHLMVGFDPSTPGSQGATT